MFLFLLFYRDLIQISRVKEPPVYIVVFEELKKKLTKYTVNIH